MRFVMTLSLLLGACYASHGIDGDADAGARRDASRFDVPGVDVSRFDVPGFDASRFDASRFDASRFDDAGRDSGRDAGVVCRDIRLVDEARIEWPSIDCGAVGFPRVAAQFAEGGPFKLLVTEFRRCRDRAARLLTRRIGVEGGRIDVGAETNVGDAESVGNLASTGEDFAVCSGSTLYSETSTGPEPLQPPCGIQANCAGLAYDGDDWGVGWIPGCNGSGEVSRGGPSGARHAVDAFASIASSRNGFGALVVNSGTLTLLDWPRSTPQPTELQMDAGRLQDGLAALRAWPFVADAWGVYTIEGSTLRVRVFTAGGELFIDERHDIELPGYAPFLVRASSSSAGTALVISYGWAGGRIDSATRLLVFGPEGFPIGDERSADLGNVSTGADVAMSGRSILVHRGARAVGVVGATDVLLFECF